MKSLNNYILEKILINKNSKFNTYNECFNTLVNKYLGYNEDFKIDKEFESIIMDWITENKVIDIEGYCTESQLIMLPERARQYYQTDDKEIQKLYKEINKNNHYTKIQKWGFYMNENVLCINYSTYYTLYFKAYK